MASQVGLAKTSQEPEMRVLVPLCSSASPVEGVGACPGLIPSSFSNQGPIPEIGIKTGVAEKGRSYSQTILPHTPYESVTNSEISPTRVQTLLLFTCWEALLCRLLGLFQQAEPFPTPEN